MVESETMDTGYLAELSALYEISSIPTSLISHEELGRVVLDKATRLLGAPIALLYRWKGDDRALQLWAARGVPLAEVEHLSPEDKAIARALDESGPVALEGADAVRALGVLPAGYSAQQGLCLPIRVGASVTALLCVFRLTDSPFTRTDLALFNVLADRTGMALETIRLFAETEQRYRELQQELAGRKRIEEALAQEQHLLHTLMDNVPDAIYFKDTHSRFIRINKAHAERWFGLSDPRQAVGKTDFDFFAEEHAQLAYEDEQEVMRSGQPLVKEEKETWPDGRETWVATIKMPLRDKEGNIVGIFGISRDITERRRAEEALRKAHEELERYTASLERRTAQLQVAAEVARDAARILDVRQLLDETVHLVSDRFGFYHAGAFLVDEPGKYAVLRAASSEGGHRMLERGHKLKIGEVGIVGHVATTGEPRIALDVGTDAVFFDNPDLSDTRSEMALPLKVRDRIIGVLDVQSTQEAAFSEDDVAVLQTLADQLAVAIENARLVERTEAQLRELSLLQSKYSAAWAKLAPSRRQLGYVYDRVDVVPAEKLPLPALDLALARGETIALTESETTEAVLATPLKLRDQIIGALGIQATDVEREWSPNEIALVEAVSEQVALALENARLFAETQKAAQQTQALYETSRVLSSSLERERTIHALLEAIYHALGCEYALISIVNEAANTIGIQHGIWHGEFDVFPEWIHMAQYPLDHPDILTDIYRTGRTEIIEGWDARFNREIWEKFGHERFRRIFSPIKMRDRVLGVVEVGYDKREKDHIDEEDVQMLTAFMDQAAVTLENARLFEEARVHAEELAALNELGQALTTRLNVEGVLDEVYQGASRLVDTTNFYVALYDPDKDEITFAFDVAEGAIRRPYTTRRTGQGLTEYVVRTQQPLLIRENVTERLEDMGIELIGQTSLSWLGVPLIVGGRVLGVMAVQSYTTPRIYDEHDQDLMTAIASQAAIALQNAHLFEETQRRATQLAAAAEVARNATAILDVDQLLDETVGLISEQFGYYHAGVFLLDERDEYAVLRAASSEGGQRMLERGHKLRAGEVGIVGHVVTTGEPRIALDVGADAEFIQTPDLPDTRSEMALPLKVRERVIGVLDVQSTQEAAFGEDSVAVLQTLADQLATAITNARLFQEVRADVTRRAFINEVLQAATSSLDPRELLGRAGEAISRQLEMPTMVLEWDPEGDVLQLMTVHDPGGTAIPVPQPIAITPEAQPAMFEALYSRQLQTFFDRPAQVQDDANRVVQAFDLVGGTYIPLVSRDQVLGLLVLGQQQGHSPLDEGELAFVQIVAANLSVALENARLYQAAVRRARRERLAREITAKIVGSTDLDTILRTTAQELSKALGTSQALVRLGTPMNQ